VVSTYIGTNRTVEEILKAVKTVLLQKPDSSKAFDSFLQKRKVGNTVIDSPLSTREDGPAEGKSVPKVAANGSAGGSRASEKARPSSGGSEGTSNGKSTENGTNTKEESQGGAQSNGSIPEGEGWSETQEVALVKAIKAFPKDTANRWDRIAAAVPAKNKQQCFKKFAELRESFRSTKKAE
jgi:DnaJ family protein C protein 2